MKRLSLVALLLAGSVAAAHADNDIYTNMLKQKRGDDALHADAAVCDAELGAPQNGTATSRQYKSCMRARGWRFSHTIREPRRRDDGYPDPDNPGLVCPISRSAASPARAARIFECKRCALWPVILRSAHCARLEGSTARLVAVHPSRRRFAAPPATTAKPLRGDDGVREKQSARRGRPPGAELMPVECFRTRRE